MAKAPRPAAPAAPAPKPAPPKAAPKPAPIETEGDDATETQAAEPAPKPAKKVSTSKAVVKVDEKSRALATISRLQQHAGLGMEEAEGDDFAIPFLKLLGAQSPAIGKVEGAEPGDFFNDATNELWLGSDGVEFVPCAFQRRWIEWAPDRGGYVNQHVKGAKILASAVRKGTKDVLPNGNEVQNTAQFIGLVRGENGWSPVCLSMKSTQLKKARRWLTTIRGQLIENEQGEMFNPPALTFIYTIKSVAEENQQGRWFGFDIQSTVRPTDSEPGLLDQAFSLAMSIKGGEARVKEPEQEGGSKPGSKGGFDEGSDVDEAGDEVL